MLRELRIENLLLIERAELQLGSGLNVLTGETGAGKTVLAHSLDLLMGGKAKRGIVRPGADEAWVEGVFDLPPAWFTEPGLNEILERLPAGSEELVLGRRVSAGGRTSAFVGGRAATAADLRILTERLLAFYGQHEHRRLTISSAQLAMVDGAGGKAQGRRLAAYRDAWDKQRNARTELDELLGRDQARERTSTSTALNSRKSNRQVRGSTRRTILRVSATGCAMPKDFGWPRTTLATELRGDEGGEGATNELAAASTGIGSVAGVDPELDKLAGRVESLVLEAEDIGAELRSYLEGIAADPQRLAEIEVRLDQLDRLERKHGGSIEKVLEHAEWCRAEIDRLEGGESREQELRQELAVLEEVLGKAAADLTAGRSDAARKLSEAVTTDLNELAMNGATLEIELVGVPDGAGPSGAETVEFMLAPNPGMDAQPLRDSASGGELSRVMLALAGLGAGDDHRALIFDEIDAGIGGNTATAVGERLRTVATDRQVLAITHLPQVASRADTHFTIAKGVESDTATATVTSLKGEAVVEEVRRMMGAESGDEAATRHARELVASQH
ncbi:MAG: DNA repair protein RecN [Solirubrobacterales bacterium]|nr:DNA repair protein RecN [Solirubrobacterales bacterium]